MSTIALNAQQSAALAAVRKGKNIFLTGAGGTGKTHTIRAITDWAVAAGIRFAVTALTGCAALLLSSPHVKAKTLHSWAGIGLAREAPHELAEAVKRNKGATRRWLDTQLLIVDEVSMMTPELLEKLDLVARRIRRRPDQRFGGLQLVLAGDFCQLPPVTRGLSGEDTTAPRFAFELPMWPTLIDEVHELTVLCRQKDPVFQAILGEARRGALSPESITALEKRMGLPWQENEIRPTLLFTRNAEVDAVNARNMAALEGARETYEAMTVVMEKTGAGKTVRRVAPDDPDVRAALDRLDSDAPYEPTLTLCVGAQVMLLVNMDQERGLVNGSRGVVTGYTGGGLPVVRFVSCAEPVIVDRVPWWLADYDGIGRAQIPLRIAYAITIHKSQGATLDSALIDIGSSTFEFGQAYVALSRVRSLDSLYIWKLDPRKVRCHPAVAEFYAGLTAAGAGDPTTTVTAAAEADAEADPAPAAPWITDGLSPAWSAVVEPFLASPTGRRLAEQLTARAAVSQIAPAPEDVFAALRVCPDPAAVRVVILGQDPYPTAGNAHGLAFSVRPSVTKLPPSLQNIFKELATDLGPATATATSGCLSAWAAQGVLLLNDVLTVTVGAPLSHSGLGWEELTSQILATVLSTAPHVVVIAWGRQAQKKLPAAAAATAKHTILRAPHPSPLSAHTGFFGSRPFSQTNAALIAHGQEPIHWSP